MKVELPGEIKSFADIETGECFAFSSQAGHFRLYEGGVAKLHLDSCIVVSVG